MPTLVVIGSPDEWSATWSSKEVVQRAERAGLEPEATAVIRRDRVGRFHVTTTHYAVADSPSWAMLWEPLFGLLFFVPVHGMPTGSGLAAIMSALQRAGFDLRFQSQVQDLLQPGTSALFVMVDDDAFDGALPFLSTLGSPLLTWSLTGAAEDDLQTELRGARPGL